VLEQGAAALRELGEDSMFEGIGDADDVPSVVSDDEVAAGRPRPLEHAALRALRADELYDVEWLDADLPVVAAIERVIRAS
jgi:hypothetical protein